MIIVMFICIAIVLIVIALSVITINKAYKFKHTIDETTPYDSSKEE